MLVKCHTVKDIKSLLQKLNVPGTWVRIVSLSGISQNQWASISINQYRSASTRINEHQSESITIHLGNSSVFVLPCRYFPSFLYLSFLICISLLVHHQNKTSKTKSSLHFIRNIETPPSAELTSRQNTKMRYIHFFFPARIKWNYIVLNSWEKKAYFWGGQALRG